MQFSWFNDPFTLFLSAPKATVGTPPSEIRKHISQSAHPSSTPTNQTPNATQTTIVHPSPTPTKQTPNGTQTFMFHPSLSVVLYSTNIASPSRSIVTPTQGPTKSSPKELELIKIEVTLDLEFKPGYANKESNEYKTLEKNLTVSLERVYENVEGFIRIEIIAFREGSVICDFIVVMRSDSGVEPYQLKETLQEKIEKSK